MGEIAKKLFLKKTKYFTQGLDADAAGCYTLLINT